MGADLDIRCALLQSSSDITGTYRRGRVIHSFHYRFLSLPWDSNPFLLCLFPSLWHLFLVCIDSQIEHYEGLPSPDVIQSNKKQELISYLCGMLHFPSSLRRHSQHYQSFDYPEQKWTQTSSSFGPERPELHIEIQLKAVPYVFV